jgi:hypothetical protein
MARSPRTDLSAFLVITAVSVLVWSWAAGETRIAESLDIRATFQADAETPGRWEFEPRSMVVELELGGSRLSVRRAREQLRDLILEVRAEEGVQTIDLERLILEAPEAAGLGVTLNAVTPPRADVRIRRIITERATVSRTIPGIELEGEAEVERDSVDVTLPQDVRARIQGPLVVEPVLPPDVIGEGSLGTRVTWKDVPLRVRGVPEGARPTISPPTLQLTFTPRRRTDAIVLSKAVRVNVLVSPEDRERIEVDPGRLFDVRLEGPSDVIASLRDDVDPARAGIPMAVLQLRSLELAGNITDKRISGWVVLMPDGRMVAVDGRIVGTGEQRPRIGVRIAEPGGS